MIALTFIIPMRHHENSANWGDAQQKLLQTVRSIQAQTSPNWLAVIVVNEGSTMPSLPIGFSVVRVPFAPNRYHDKERTKPKQFYDAIRRDKGRRVLAGLLHTRPSGHVMIVDDDDLIHRDLTRFAESHHTENGWRLEEGWVWVDGGSFLLPISNFSRLCGTSHIVRADLYSLPASLEEADMGYVMRCFGSHIYIDEMLLESLTPLKALPFRGAVYRVGHVGSHSRSRGHLKQYLKGCTLAAQLAALMGLRIRSQAFKQVFWGADATPLYSGDLLN